MALDIRAIENKIRNSFAVLGNRNDYLASPLTDIFITGVRCGIIRGRRVVAVPVSQSFDLTAKRIGGIKIEIAELKNHGFALDGRYLLIWCIKFRLREAFNRLMADLLYDLQPVFKLREVTDRLEGWKLLLTGSDDKNEEKGLWGELFFLRFLMQNNYAALDNWKGPLGGTKDFQFENRRAEVKTTAVRSGWPVTMHGLYQASSIEGCSDFLIFIRVEEDNNGISVSEMITEIRALINVCELDLFDNLLSGFNHDIVSSTRKWAVLDARIFEMDEQLPSLKAESFVAGTLPQGVLDISYTIDLSGLQSSVLNKWNSI